MGYVVVPEVVVAVLEAVVEHADPHALPGVALVEGRQDVQADGWQAGPGPGVPL